LRLFRRPHQGIDWELWLQVIWCGKPLSSAPPSAKGCLKFLLVNQRGRTYSRPVEATPTRRSGRHNVKYPSLLGYPVFRAFPQLWGKCRSINE
jgi:hypothetical protein